MDDTRNTWETTVRMAANTMLGYPDRISDGLEAELYALLEKLDTADAGPPESMGKPDDPRITPEKELLLTVIEDGTNLWRYNLSEPGNRHDIRSL